MDRPRIVVTLAVAARQVEPDIAARKNQLYLDGIARHGGEPVALDATADGPTREAALGSMDGLLMSGGADLDPARYGQPNRGSEEIEPDRDELEARAWAVAGERRVPVLGICRGFQAINVFSGGGLLQDVAGHRGPGWGHGPAKTHAMRLVPGTRLARILSPAKVVGATEVNTYHHQGVRATDLAPGLVANAWAVQSRRRPGRRRSRPATAASCSASSATPNGRSRRRPSSSDSGRSSSTPAAGRSRPARARAATACPAPPTSARRR